MLPLNIRGLLTDYQVELVSKVDEEESAGEHCSTQVPATIRIDDALPEWWQWQTLFHEMLHMWEEEQHLDLTEDQIERLALAMYGCWHRNCWVLPGARDPFAFRIFEPDNGMG